VSTRNCILLVSLWLSVIALSTWVGGTLYQMLVIVPLWSGSPPESVRTFFQTTDYNRTIFHFFGPPFIVARNVPLVAALITGWHLPRHRRALLIATLCFTVFGALFTVFYVYPINALLFEQAGGSLSADQIRALATEWIFRDRVRFGIGLIGLVAVLHAFRLPIPHEEMRQSRAA
jgi:hypothetical protein